jgi:tight adherence protein C
MFLAIRLLSFLVLSGLGLALLYLAPPFDLRSDFKLLTLVEIVGVAAYAPMLILRRVAAARQVRLRRALPDALDLMVICAEAGIALEATLQRVAREVASAAPAMGQELKITALELGVLPDRRRALENFALRTQVPSIRGVTSTLIQAERYGTPLAQSLRILAAEFRNDRMMLAEERAAKLPVKLTVPLILFILPALFIVLLGPAIVKALESISRM